MIIRVYIESINTNKLGNIEDTHTHNVTQKTSKKPQKTRATEEDKKYQY